MAFAILTRDMNRLAIQSCLLGAQLLGLENVVVAQGDPFSPADSRRVAAVSDYRPTELISHIARMNLGLDFRGRQLDSPTHFCIGATVDPNRDLVRQASLACRKVMAGANFLITQPVYDPEVALRFLDAYSDQAGSPCPAPIYWGLQMLEEDSIAFGPPPAHLTDQVARGRSPADLALEIYTRFLEAAMFNFYLLPSIRRRGERGYASAQNFLAAARSMS